MSYKTASPDRYGLLKGYARENRKNATLAESVLWEHLRKNSFGQKFLRQHIIGDYIVDFFFRKSRVIVEIDGGYHFAAEQQKADTLRTECLEVQGYKVVRFTNEQVLCDTNNVINEVKRILSGSPLKGKNEVLLRENIGGLSLPPKQGKTEGV
jgi:very-short-patch-repair endonuclease